MKKNRIRNQHYGSLTKSHDVSATLSQDNIQSASQLAKASDFHMPLISNKYSSVERGAAVA